MIVTHSANFILVFWIAIVCIVLIGTVFGSWVRVSRHRMIERLAEKGQPIPPELLAGERYYSYSRYRHPIGSGIYLMCIGIALSLFMWALTGWGGPFYGAGPPSWLVIIGIFPFMIGVARVLSGIFERPPTK